MIIVRTRYNDFFCTHIADLLDRIGYQPITVVLPRWGRGFFFLPSFTGFPLQRRGRVLKRNRQLMATYWCASTRFCVCLSLSLSLWPHIYPERKKERKQGKETRKRISMISMMRVDWRGHATCRFAFVDDIRCHRAVVKREASSSTKASSAVSHTGGAACHWPAGATAANGGRRIGWCRPAGRPSAKRKRPPAAASFADKHTHTKEPQLSAAVDRPVTDNVNFTGGRAFFLWPKGPMVFGFDWRETMARPAADDGRVRPLTNGPKPRLSISTNYNNHNDDDDDDDDDDVSKVGRVDWVIKRQRVRVDDLQESEEETKKKGENDVDEEEDGCEASSLKYNRKNREWNHFSPNHLLAVPCVVKPPKMVQVMFQYFVGKRVFALPKTLGPRLFPLEAVRKSEYWGKSRDLCVYVSNLNKKKVPKKTKSKREGNELHLEIHLEVLEIRLNCVHSRLAEIMSSTKAVGENKNRQPTKKRKKNKTKQNKTRNKTRATWYRAKSAVKSAG